MVFSRLQTSFAQLMIDKQTKLLIKRRRCRSLLWMWSMHWMTWEPQVLFRKLVFSFRLYYLHTLKGHIESRRVKALLSKELVWKDVPSVRRVENKDIGHKTENANSINNQKSSFWGSSLIQKTVMRVNIRKIFSNHRWNKSNLRPRIAQILRWCYFCCWNLWSATKSLFLIPPREKLTTGWGSKGLLPQLVVADLDLTVMDRSCIPHHFMFYILNGE